MNKLALTFALAALALALAATAAPSAAADVLPEHEIKRVVDRHSDEIRTCYERHALKQRRATGAVTLGFVVERSGEVRESSIEVQAPGVEGRSFSRCVERAVASWRFASARHPTGVEYPFYFHHTRARGAGPRR